MTELPQIETERLVLRVPTADDAAAMALFASENREHFAPWDPVRDEGYFTEEYWRRELAEAAERVRAGTSIRFVLVPKADGLRPIIGHCTFSNIVRGAFQAAYLGYGLDRHAVGKGLMEEALRAAIGYCFEELGLHRVMANYMPTNERSGRVLAKLGFVPEGYARDYLLLAGDWQDHVLTALTNQRWKPSRSAPTAPRTGVIGSGHEPEEGGLAELRHLVAIDAPVSAVYRALTEQAGLAGWWTTAVVAEPRVGSVAEFDFGDRYHNEMRVAALDRDARVEWHCLDGDDEWIGTSLVFSLQPDDGGTIVRLTHGGWRAETDFFAACNSNWGFYMRSLKSFCETGEGDPHTDDD
jgi:ribosomal-protein-alanine N-acetyltransferase